LGTIGTNEVHIVTWRGCLVEGLVTALLVMIILNSAYKHSLIVTQAAIAVGAAVVVAGLIAGELTTASLNPARSLGPAIMSGNYNNVWVFIAGPFGGAAVALGVVTVVRPAPNTDEAIAAEGDQ
jgi:aquaporin Z